MVKIVHRSRRGYRALRYVIGVGLLGCSCVFYPLRSGATDLERLIDNVQMTYDQTRAMTAEFVQVATLTSINRQQTSSGTLSVQKPHLIRWEYTQPEAQTILYDGKTLRIYTPRRHQILQSQVDETQQTNVALLFLAGMGKLRDAFSIETLPSIAPQHVVLRLLPLSPQATFTELHLTINTQNYFVEQLQIYDTIGNLTEITLSALQTYASLPEQTFTLVFPPETEILTPSALSGQ